MCYYLNEKNFKGVNMSTKNPFIIDDNYPNLTPVQKKKIRVNNVYMILKIDKIIQKLLNDQKNKKYENLEVAISKIITEINLTGRIKLPYSDSETGVNTNNIDKKLAEFAKKLIRQLAVPKEPKMAEYGSNYGSFHEDYNKYKKSLEEYKNFVSNFKQSNFYQLYSYLIDGKLSQGVGKYYWSKYKQVKEGINYTNSLTAAFDFYQKSGDKIGLDIPKLFDLSFESNTSKGLTIKENNTLSHYDQYYSVDSITRTLEILRTGKFNEYYEIDEKDIDDISLG